MSAITITDPALIEQLSRVEAVELRAPDGRVLGEFTTGEAPPVELARLLEIGQELRLPPGTQSPIPEDVRRENRKHVTGRPLADVMRDLKARAAAPPEAR